MIKKPSPIWIIFFTILIDMLGVGILIPVIPLLLTDPAYAYHLPLGVSQGYIILGFLTAIFPFMQFIATPILGQLSDRIGRKKVLAFSLGGTALSYVIFAIGIIFKNIPLLFISRAVDGISGGNIAVAQAAIADSSAPQDRAKNFGLIGAAFGIGFIIGPFLGGVLSNPNLISWFNATTPFWFVAILSTLNMLSVIFFFDETIKEKMKGKFHALQSLINIKAAVLSQKFRAFFGTAFLYTAGFNFFTTFFGVFLIKKFNYDQGGIGLYFAFVGILIALTQGLIVGFVAKRMDGLRTISIALFVFAITLLIVSQTNVQWLLYIITIPQCIAIGLIMANLTAVISNNALDNEQGKVLGINASVQALAQSIPPIISGYIAASIGAYAPVLVAATIVFLAGISFVTFVAPRFRKITTSH